MDGTTNLLQSVPDPVEGARHQSDQLQQFGQYVANELGLFQVLLVARHLHGERQTDRDAKCHLVDSIPARVHQSELGRERRYR
jgi:hypothetical protein